MRNVDWVVKEGLIRSLEDVFRVPPVNRRRVAQAEIVASYKAAAKQNLWLAPNVQKLALTKHCLLNRRLAQERNPGQSRVAKITCPCATTTPATYMTPGIGNLPL